MYSKIVCVVTYKVKQPHTLPPGFKVKRFQSASFQVVTSDCDDSGELCLGHAECIELLAQYGADVDQHVDQSGLPLHVACSNQHLSTVKKLLQLGKRNFNC